ncbi:MAG: AAA family ATPase [Methylophaga sp.]
MTEMHATAEPAYLDRLALHSNPFSRQNLPGAFFAGRQTSQRLNLILHLLRSSSQISVLTAPDGYGKSMLLTALQQRGGEDLRFCLVSANNHSNLPQITQHCLQAFGATGDSQLGGDQQQLLRQRLQQLLQIQVTPVLLIDDAEQLDNSVQQQLATWLHWQHEGQYLLRAVVTSNKASALQHLRNERFQDLDVLPLAEDEINGYLQQRMQAAGWQDDLPFTDKQLQRIARRSKGIPSEINHQAHQSLLGVNRSWQLPTLPAWRLPHWFRWLPVLPVVLALALILIFQQNINDWLNQNRGKSDETITELSAEPELPMVIVEDNTVTSNAKAEKQNLIELLNALEEEQASETDATMADSTPDVPQSNLSASEQASDNDQPAPVTTETNNDQPASVIPPFTPLDEMPEKRATVAPITDADSSSTTEANPSASNNPENNDNEVRGAKWIMQQKKSAYTYQLMGTWDRSEVDEFIEKIFAVWRYRGICQHARK